MSSLFTDFLSALKVKHTVDYSDSRFEDMPFQSMFGLANLLKEYNVTATGVSVDAASKADAISRFSVPFLADTNDGFAIVLKLTDGTVTYMSQHKTFTTALSKFLQGWNGIALLASTDESSGEPGYIQHHIGDIFRRAKKWILVFLVFALVGFAMWQSELYSRWTAWLLVILDCLGIYLSWMLVQKSLGIRNTTADAMCSALDEGGCDEIARSQASSFFGLVKWSEVGLAYFSTSLFALLMFPESLPALAAINILCLPYTLWSISYQKFVAKMWCTLCVCVQASLWILFATYLLGGWTREILPLSSGFLIQFVVLAFSYGIMLLGINLFDETLVKYLKK